LRALRAVPAGPKARMVSSTLPLGFIGILYAKFAAAKPSFGSLDIYPPSG
jgi:hypothetical protein